MKGRLSGRHVVLLGIGHTNAHVVRMWKMQALHDTDLTCLSNNTIATYSGMLPAVLAGQIPHQQMEIDLVQLCASVGARLITDPVQGIDHPNKEVLFADRPPVPFDVLSIGIGSTASTEGVRIEDSETLVQIKPMQTFLERLQRALAKAEERSASGELRVVVVGSGVAGIEVTFCIPAFISSMSKRPISLDLVTRSDAILPEVSDRTRELVAGELGRRSVSVRTGRAVTRVASRSVDLDDGGSIEADLVIWTTSAAAPELLCKLGLALDERGFLATHHTLQSTSSPGVFAVGDTGTIVGQPLPKAGVYAVRQGPVLWENIKRSLDGRPLQQYRPQHSFLKLINLGDGRAIGQWRGMAVSGRWVMRLKNSIDSRFIDKYRAGPMSGDATMDAGETAVGGEMQCRGCGCKLGSDILQSALAADSKIMPEDAVEIGGGDAAARLVASTDFFSSPVDDPFLAGRIAALHSASDIVASGAKVTEALANVVLPEGDPAAQRRALSDFMEGARCEFDAMNASVVGGHTIVGPRMEVGFTVIGRPLGKSLIRKGNLRVGDHLYLTKPIGIGVLLAAQMRSMCPARDYETLISAMLQRQHPLARVAVDVGLDAGTDVTGFGLVGHLIEMLSASNVAAVISLQEIPTLPGAIELVEQGVESSLAPENLRIQSDVAVPGLPAEACRAKYRILFDPQTCGGLLLGAREDQQQQLVEQVCAAGLPSPVPIGRVTDREPARKMLTVQ